MKNKTIVVDLNRDSASVTALYVFENHGQDTLLQVSFPDIFFQNGQRDYRSYTEQYVSRLTTHIKVHNKKLDHNNMYYPQLFDSLMIYANELNIHPTLEPEDFKRFDNLHDRILLNKSNPECTPLYVWEEEFMEGRSFVDVQYMR